MRGARATLIAILLVGTAMTATANDMVLTRTGELYRVAQGADGLVVSQRLADGTVDDYLVPQTAGIVATSVQVGVDELTGAIFVVWLQGNGFESTLQISWLADNWWIGPYRIAGRDGSVVENPQMMLDRVVTVIEEDGESIEVATTFLHMVWWSFTDNLENGSAMLASIPLDEHGNPKLDEFEPVTLSDLLPYGVGCQGISDAAGLAFPKVFSDPQSGAPHVFATDFSNCAFQIIGLEYEVVEEWVVDIKRRRHIVLLGNTSTIAVNPDVVLSNAKVEVGHGLDLVMYWDTDDAIEYVQLDENGVPPVQSLGYGQILDREEALEMVRNLVH